jgi:RNA polymerase sigma-70 factor (ECF subfamily)
VSGARAVVPRIGGGAFALLEDGTLLRHDRHGALSGRAVTPLRTLASAGPYACGLVEGGVGCFRDRHEDLTCRALPFEPELALFDVPSARALSGDLGAPALRVTDLRGVTRVYRLSMTCGEHCIRFGCSGEAACADRCAAGQVPEVFFKPMGGSGDSPGVNARTRELAVSAVSGELSLDAIARRELPRVERLLLRILGPRADLEDLVQTVFLELCRALPRYRGDAELSTFVGGITIRVARRTMRRSAFFTRRGPMPAEPASASDDPETGAAARQELAVLRGALERLSAKKRIAFSLWAFEGMDVSEIAELMGASVAATRSRIWYAQKELRERARRDPALREAMGEG